MELQLQDLISSIKKDGVDAANTEAARIVADAKVQAEKIIADARMHAGVIVEDAENEADRLEATARISAEQARRDAALAFSKQIEDKYKSLLSSAVSKSVNDKSLVSLIRALLANEEVSGYTAELAEVTDGLKAALADEIKSGLEIRASKGVRGFRLSANDGSGYFDCTADELVSMLMPFLNGLDI